MCFNFYVRFFDLLLKIIGLNYYYNDEKDNGWYILLLVRYMDLWEKLYWGFDYDWWENYWYIVVVLC